MKLTNLVTNQNLSERLKKLGVPQVSQFYWNKFQDDDHDQLELLNYKISEFETFSAFLSGELGAMLPEKIKNKESEATLLITKECEIWEVSYPNEITRTIILTSEDTLADALGKMLAYLIEHQIIDVATLKI